MTKQTGLDEMWNRLSKKEKIHFETKYLVDLCECAREDGRHEGRLEAYKDILVFALESDYCDNELLIGLCKKELSSPSRRSLVQSTRRGGKE